GVGRIPAGARKPSRTGHDIRAAEVLCVRENLMLHTRSLHRGQACPQALVLFLQDQAGRMRPIKAKTSVSPPMDANAACSTRQSTPTGLYKKRQVIQWP